AERLWRDAVTWQPDNLSLWSRLLEASLRTGAEASQSRYLDEIRRIEGPGGPLGHFGEGSRLMEMARRGNRKLLVQAHTEFAEAARQQPGWPRVALRQAELDELEVKPQQALEHYCRAIDCGERRPSVLRRTVQLLYERHNYVQVDAVLRKLQEQAPLSNDLQRMAAEISLQNLDPDQAVAQAHQAVTAESKDYRDHMWLGHMLSALGHKAEAERSFRRAIELAQQVPAPWIALVRCQISAGQRDAAEKTLHEAQAKLPAGQAALPLAHGYAAIGRMDRAEEQIQAALSTKPADPTLLAAVGLFYLHGGQPQKGVPFLRQILDPRLHAPQDTLAWARRNLAVTLVSTGGNYAQFREALAMLDENSRQHQDSPEDQRARASVLATRPGHRREAIDLYEDLRQRFSLSHLEEFSLARLYEAEHDWPRAREGMLKVVSAESNNPRYLAPYVRSLLSHGLADEAKDWLARLEQLQAASPDAIALKARMLAVRGQPADVLRLLNTYTDEKLANPREAAARMRLAALVLDELSEAPSSFAKLLSSEADKLYQRYASQANDPTSLLLYVRFLARQRRVGDALEVCERALQTHPAAAVMHAAMVVLHAGSAKQEHCLRVERWLTAALEKSPTAGMLIQLAELRALQGRYPDAEELYRRVIAHDPRNIVALNNLAYLLAFEENRGAEALDMIERAVTLAGASAELLDTRGVAFVAAGQPAAALKDLEEAISEAPTGALYFHLAWAHQQAGQLAAAATALQTAENVGLQPLHPLDREKLLQLRVALR
ncbi:MAG TPA: tetratricopeptide repeat protein, partial [Gemmataceae bacterium]|nr:tetratricopeptide repeat protein [Gemmataceae bacterium]